MKRELIYKTLFDKLSDVTLIRTASRRLKHYDEVSQADTPALFLVEKDEIAKTITGMSTKWTFLVDVFIYVNIGNENEVSPYSDLNDVLDELLEMFDNKLLPSGVQTLDGLVHSVKLNGTIKKDGGSLGSIAICQIPLEIIVNN